MDSQTIEDHLKGMLGLNLGAGPPAAPGAYPRQKTKHVAENTNKQNEEQQKGKEGRKNSEAAQATEEGFLREAEKESKMKKPDDYTPPDTIIEFLAAKYLRPLRQRSPKFQRAKWFCHLCEYHCDNLVKCFEHYKDTRHSRLTRLKEFDTTLENIPRPTKLQCDSLNILLNNNDKEFGISKAGLEERKAVVAQVQKLLESAIPGCVVRAYGSSLSGFALKTSNVNLDLQITKEEKPHLALIQGLELLHKSKLFRNVEDDFNSKLPAIRFQTMSGLDVELSLNNQHAFQTSSILKDYMDIDPRVRVLGVNFRYWAQITRLDKQAEGTLSPHTFSILLVYFLQQLDTPVLPCLHDFMEDSSDEIYTSNPEKIRAWKCENTESVAELWIKLFQFYGLSYKVSELVVSIRQTKEMTNEDKDWKSKRLAVEDPYSIKRNLCRSIQQTPVFNYISDCFKTSYLYFGTMQTCHGSIITKILPTEEGEAEPVEMEGLRDWTLESWLTAKGTVLTTKQVETAIALVPKNMVSFVFSVKRLTEGNLPAAFCAVCNNEGHVTSSCPEEQLPPLLPLPALKPDYLRLIDRICIDVARNWAPQAKELADRSHIMTDLNGYISRIFKSAELTLFGSSSNGFAFRHSDLDISLTFQDKPTAEGLDCIQIIEQLADKIKRMAGVKNVLAITSAKVPIVKLFYHHLEVDADISLYNVLARENTKLLSLYSELDPRVRTLGYMVKLFAKACDIGDASRGSLSSYAYILMMIYFLQQTEPAVIPVIQEMHDGPKPENIVDGWNAWFQSDKTIINKWKTKNKCSLGVLWIKFLSFYAGEWDDQKLVVSIRQKKPLTKFEKMWNSSCIAIEDPFELSHNLGVGISRRMNIYIKKTFIKARSLFGNPRPELHRFIPRGYRSHQDFFFDVRLLTDGPPPNDRGCRICGKIGHLMADCPRKRMADQKKKMNKEQRNRTQSEQGPAENANDKGRSRTKSEIPPGSKGKHAITIKPPIPDKVKDDEKKRKREAKAAKRKESKAKKKAQESKQNTAQEKEISPTPSVVNFNYNMVAQAAGPVSYFNYFAPISEEKAGMDKQMYVQAKINTNGFSSTKSSSSSISTQKPKEKKQKKKCKNNAASRSSASRDTVDPDLMQLGLSYMERVAQRKAETKFHQYLNPAY